MAKVFIGTPSAGGHVKAEYNGSLARMIARLERSGIQTDFQNIDGPDSAIQRDGIVQKFLASDFTHLLQTDSDMMFPPDLCGRMLAFDKPVIGAIYTRRIFNIVQMRDLMQSGTSFDDAYSMAHVFNIELLNNTISINQDGFGRVAKVGTGFMLIRRDAFEAMKAKVEPYQSESLTVGGSALLAYFRRIGALSDDFSFCKRWTDHGGEVWACDDPQVRHIGDFQYGVSLRQHVAALSRNVAPAQRSTKV